jgi:hypothetical protein
MDNKNGIDRMGTGMVQSFACKPRGLPASIDSLPNSLLKFYHQACVASTDRLVSLGRVKHNLLRNSSRFVANIPVFLP